MVDPDEFTAAVLAGVDLLIKKEREEMARQIAAAEAGILATAQKMLDGARKGAAAEMRAEVAALGAAHAREVKALDTGAETDRAQFGEKLAALEAQTKAAQTAAAVAVADLAGALGRIEAIETETPVLPSPGLDGRGIADVKQNDDGELIVKYTTGETENVGRVAGRDAVPVEGLEFFDDERCFGYHVIVDGKAVRREVIEKAGIWYQGVWQKQGYLKSDAVTYGGGVWYCKKEHAEAIAPGTDPEIWTLSNKRGPKGAKGDPGRPGPGKMNIDGTRADD